MIAAISIHAPMWGATSFIEYEGCLINFNLQAQN